MSYLLEILAKGLDASVGETLERLYRPGDGGASVPRLEALCRENPGRADLLFQLGVAYLQAMQCPQAARNLAESCRLKPDHLPARLALAGAYDELGQADKALAHLHIARDVQPGNGAVLFATGLCLEKLSRSQEAAGCYRDVIKLQPDFLPARQRLAAVAVFLEEMPEAIAQYEALRTLNPQDVDVRAALAHLYYRLGQFDEAAREFQTVIAMEPDNWALVDDQVEALVAAGQLREAVERLNELLAAQGPFADLYLRAAELLSKMGQDAEAVRHYRSALEIDPTYLEAKIGLGAHHVREGRWEEAAEVFHEAADINDRLLTCYIGLAVAQLAKGDRIEGVGTLQLALAVEPNSTVLLKEMARLQLKSAVAEEFQQAFEVEQSLPVAQPDLDNDDLLQKQLDRHAEAVARTPEYADLHYRYGVLLRAEGRLGEAIEQFQEAVKLNPSYVAAIIRLGVTQQEVGRVDEAIATFQQALDIKGQYVDLHYRLAILYTDRREFAKAVTHMEQAAGLAPGNPKIRSSLALSLQNMGLTDKVAATWRSLTQMHKAKS
jgi:tetratricopeptide (TPR) repeat protein